MTTVVRSGFIVRHRFYALVGLLSLRQFPVHWERNENRASSELQLLTPAKRPCWWIHVALGSFTTEAGKTKGPHVCLAPEADRRADVSLCQLCASSGLMHRSKERRYSITSAAVASTPGKVTLGLRLPL